MTCKPYGTIAITPGTPARISTDPADIVASLLIQAAPTMTGSLIVKYQPEGSPLGTPIVILSPGATWGPPSIGNDIQTSKYSLDATTGATGAAAIVTGWIG